MRMPPVDFDSIVLAGGVDEVTPTLSLKNGFVRQSANFEVGVNGGYVRIGGYERVDGRTSPSSADTTRQVVSVGAYTNNPAVGNTITGQTSGATAVIACINGLKLGITKITGSFQLEDIQVGATAIGTLDSLSAGPSTPAEDATLRSAIADIYRADIEPLPGSGPVRGITMMDDIKYAFRNNVGGTACEIYKSSAAGWVNVPLYKTVTFTAGGTATPADGDTVTQGGVTATLKRCALVGGAFSGSDAEGQLIIDNVSGGNFTAGAATVGSVNVTLSGAESQLELLPDGRYEFIKTNFSGAIATTRLYGCDGVNPAFEFDGDILVPIYTKADIEAPTHIVKHRDYLMLSTESSFFWSAPGLPYNFDGAEGAGSKATGLDITGFLVMPGSTDVSTLAIYNRSALGILYGKTPADFNYVQHNIGVGAVDFTVQNMHDAIAFDDRGVTSSQTTLNFGNFNQSTLTAQILPYINAHLGGAVASTLNRRKSQYRLFFDNGEGLFITIVNGKLNGCMPIVFKHNVFCTFEGKQEDGEDVSFFGGDDGMVYQLDKGSSFDGENIDYQFTLNYSSATSPRVKKRYRKASIEMVAEGSSYVELSVGYALGFDSIEYAQPRAEGYTAYLATARWDSFEWDDFFFDTRGLEPLEVTIGGSAENIAFSLYGSSDKVSPFTINSILVHYTNRRAMR